MPDGFKVHKDEPKEANLTLSGPAIVAIVATVCAAVVLICLIVAWFFK